MPLNQDYRYTYIFNNYHVLIRVNVITVNCRRKIEIHIIIREMVYQLHNLIFKKSILDIRF